MTIAEVRAETSEQTGMTRKPGPVGGVKTMDWGRSCRRRRRRRRMLMRRRTANVQAGQEMDKIAWSQLQSRKLRLHHLVVNEQARWASDQGPRSFVRETQGLST